MVSKYLLILILSLSTLTVNAQLNKKDKEVVAKKPKAGPISNVIFQFDNRTEKYYDITGRMNGLKLGLESYKRVRVGVGFYSNNKFYPLNAPSIPVGVNQTFDMTFTNFWTEVALFKGFRYEIAFPLAIGTGHAEINTFERIGNQTTFTGKEVVTGLKTADFGVNGYYKPKPWVGVGAGVGYRANRQDHGDLNDPIATPYFDFKFKLFFGYLFKSIFNKKAIEAERLYYKERREKRMKKFKAIFS